MDDLDQKRLLELSQRLQKTLEPSGFLNTLKQDEGLLIETLEDALELAHHILRLERGGLLKPQ